MIDDEGRSASQLYDDGLLDAGVVFRGGFGDSTRPAVDGESEVGFPTAKLYSIPRMMEEFAGRDQPVKICAPMVRYSKLAFRRLVRKYGADLCFTPMIVADAFVKSVKARDSDLTTDPVLDRPLIAQFAAKDDLELGAAAEIVRPFCDGVDLNCGCPQRWAIQDGFGCCLLRKPQLVHEMVRTVKNRISDPEFNVSIKIRINDNLRETVDLCQRAEKAGVSMISIHGRTPAERHQPVHLDAIETVVNSLQVPCVANGDVKSLKDVVEARRKTGCHGVMVATGLLKNPALFAGFQHTPAECVSDWLDLSTSVGTPFSCFHHHLMDMTEKLFSKSERIHFNSLSSTSAVIDFLYQRYGIGPPPSPS